MNNGWRAVEERDRTSDSYVVWVCVSEIGDEGTLGCWSDPRIGLACSAARHAEILRIMVMDFEWPPKVSPASVSLTSSPRAGAPTPVTDALPPSSSRPS